MADSAFRNFLRAIRQLFRWSHSRQFQFRPQAADRRVAQLQAAAIERGEISYDREAQPRSRLGFVESLAAPRHMCAFGGG